MGKKLLVVGQGGREHALVWKLSQSPQVDKVFVAPGNPGMVQLAECVNISAADVDSLLRFALQEKIDLTVVGPEAPLMNGIVDVFQAHGLNIFGPSRLAAQLEGSKVFAKNLFKKHGIPTAQYEVFSEISAAQDYAKSYTDKGQAVVIKADGLAAGKGVVVAQDYAEASQAIDNIMKDKTFGEAGNKIVIEECLIGEELSFFAISDGQNFVPVMAAQDHKRVFDNDKGPNTGGMGAYTNPPVYTEALREQILNEVIKPTVEAMKKEGCPYQGVLYAGLMLTSSGPKVLEYNARFGDPETQVLMPMIKGDLFPILDTSARGDIRGCQIETLPGACVAVVLASEGYPGNYPKGRAITGLEDLNPETIVFHAGITEKDGQLLTDGGRVLAVVSRGDTISDAIKKVYDEVKRVDFEGMHYRTDIARRALS